MKHKLDMLILYNELNISQVRNLEKKLKLRALTAGAYLDIFATRARTSQATS